MKPLITILSLTLFVTSNLVGQQVLESKLKISDDPSSTRYIIFDNSSDEQYILTDFREVFEDHLGIGKNDSFVPISEKIDNIGITHTRFQQYFKNIPVEFGSYNIHSFGDKINSISGNFIKIDESVPTTPLISEARAIMVAKESSFGKISKEQIEFSSFPDSEEDVEAQCILTLLQLIDKPNLVYKVGLQSPIQSINENWYIDAITGKVIHSENRIRFSNGTASTRYSGTQSITTKSVSNHYILKDDSRGGDILVLDVNGASNLNNPYDFQDNDNVWSYLEHHNTQKDDAALDAIWGLEKSWDYYENTFSRDGWDDDNSGITCYMHFDIGISDVNAIWNNGSLKIGDGDATFDPLSTLDIIGHEFTHGVLQDVGLLSTGEAAALEEGICDMFGATIEQSVDSSKEAWTIGEELGISSDTAIKYLDNPNYMEWADTYEGDFYPTTAIDTPDEIYEASGVVAFWYYLLVEGDSGTNDNDDDFSVSGIGFNKAARIVYETCMYYLTSTSDFEDFMDYTRLRTGSLYGFESDELAEVINAWHAVGVGDFEAIVSGDDVACTSNKTYVLV
jgi:Zn-dependent metalloprotease